MSVYEYDPKPPQPAPRGTYRAQVGVHLDTVETGSLACTLSRLHTREAYMHMRSVNRSEYGVLRAPRASSDGGLQVRPKGGQRLAHILRDNLRLL